MLEVSLEIEMKLSLMRPVSLMIGVFVMTHPGMLCFDGIRVNLQTVRRTNNKGDVGIYILYERPPVQELYITRLAYLSTSTEQSIMFYKLLYFISNLS